MEIFLSLLVLLVSIYPYILLVKLLRLACKALKKYLRD